MFPRDLRDRWTRYEMNLRLRYRRAAERGHRLENGWARDLNFRGAWIELPELVEAGSALEITLATPVGSLSLVARVAWAHVGLGGAPYLHGVRFTRVSAEQRERLRTLFTHERPPPVRLDCVLAATCRRNDKERPAIRGVVQDVSDGGVCVRLPQRVAPGTDLCINAATPFGKMAADARVVWADQGGAVLPAGASYRHGLRFLHIHPFSELPLRALLLCGIDLPRGVVK